MDSIPGSTLSLQLKTNDQRTSNVAKPQEPFTRRNLKTFSILLCFVALGMNSALIGPTLVHMRHVLDVDLALMTLTFTCGRVGFLSGSILCGLIFDRFNAEVQLLVAVLWVGVCSVAQPFSPTFPLFAGLNLLQGFGRGFVDTAA